MVLGEARPYLTAFVVINQDQWTKIAIQNGMPPTVNSIMHNEPAHKLVLDRVQRLIKSFPGYAQIHRVAVMAEPWTVENGLLTPTMKLKRLKVIESHKKEFEELYAGH